MRFRPEHYLEAAYERIDAARKLHNERHYPEALYFAGVAVECLLLAYKTRENPEFESRHDLIRIRFQNIKKYDKDIFQYSE